MINTSTDNSSKNSFNTVNEVGSYISEGAQKVATTTYEHFLKPAGVGIALGMGLFAVRLGTSALCQVVGIGTSVASTAHKELILENAMTTVFVAPLVQTVLYRVLIQESLEFISKKILPDVDVTIFSHKIKLTALASIVALSALSGFMAFAVGAGLGVVIYLTVLSLALGVIKHEFGFTASLSANMTVNGLAVGLAASGV